MLGERSGVLGAALTVEEHGRSEIRYTAYICGFAREIAKTSATRSYILEMKLARQFACRFRPRSSCCPST